MVNWLARFSPKKPMKTVAEPVPLTVPLHRATYSDFDGEITHRQWTRPAGGGGEITEDLFVNPDPNSPLAGILINRMMLSADKNNLMIECIPRQGRFTEADELLKKHMLGGGVYFGVNELTAKGIRSAGVSPPKSALTMMVDFSGEDISTEGKKEVIVGRIIEIMKGTLDSDAFSTNPAIRQALVSKIQEVLLQFRAIAAPTQSAQIDISGR